jgi:hypothetical protein
MKWRLLFYRCKICQKQELKENGIVERLQYFHVCSDSMTLGFLREMITYKNLFHYKDTSIRSD